MGLFRKNAEQAFNTQGQTECGDCGAYYPAGWYNHGNECTAAQEDWPDKDVE